MDIAACQALPTSCSFLMQAAQPLSANCIWRFSAPKKCTWLICTDGTDSLKAAELNMTEKADLGQTPALATPGRLQVLDPWACFFLSHLELALTNSPMQKEHPRGGMPSCVKQSRGRGTGRESIRAMKSLVPWVQGWKNTYGLFGIRHLELMIT